MSRLRLALGGLGLVCGLSACAVGVGGGRVVHYGVGGGWGPWGGYYGGPVYVPIDVGPDIPPELEFEATPLPEVEW